MKKYYLKTFGCQMNFHDSEKISGVLESDNCTATDDPLSADIIVFNTCSIRQKAEQKFYSAMGRLQKIKKNRPDLKIIVVGCIAQQEGENIFRRIPFVDHVIGPQNISRIKEVLESGKAVLTEENREIANLVMPAIRELSFKGSVNIMYGCNNFCSYCIVPFTRGREVSRPSADILNEINGFAESGCKEITLLGQNVNSYDADMDFASLLEKVNAIPGLERIRFMTSHPRSLSPVLIAAIRDLEKVCEHIHLPLQSGSDHILGLMKRRYTFSEYREKVDSLRRAIPEIAITTDIIAGFPSESQADHEDTMSALREIEFDGIFAFSYSIRPMTSAAEMKNQIEDSIKLQRLNEILDLQDEITLNRNKRLIGKSVDVIIEDISSSVAIGRTRTNKIVNIPLDKSINLGEIVDSEIMDAHKHSLEARLIS